MSVHANYVMATVVLNEAKLGELEMVRDCFVDLFLNFPS